MSDFTKEKVFRCYELIKAFLHDDPEDSVKFSELCEKIDILKLVLPKDIHEKLTGFVNDYLAPIVFDSENILADCYTPDIGYYKSEDCLVIKDDKALAKLLGLYFSKIHEIETAFDDLAAKELRPYLFEN